MDKIRLVQGLTSARNLIIKLLEARIPLPLITRILLTRTIPYFIISIVNTYPNIVLLYHISLSVLNKPYFIVFNFLPELGMESNATLRLFAVAFIEHLAGRKRRAVEMQANCSVCVGRVADAMQTH